MGGFAEFETMLERAIKAFTKREFLEAIDMFEMICNKFPRSWSARYYHAMTLCAVGDFSDARKQLSHIFINSEEEIWQDIAQSGIALVDSREAGLRQSLASLI